MRPTTALLACALAFVPLLARAEYCAEQPWQDLGAAYGHARLPEAIEDAWARCQALPGSPGQAAVALVYPAKDVATPARPADPLAGVVAELLLVDTGSGRVLSRQTVERPVTTDGSAVTGVEIDTESPVLAPGVRSVGLRVQHALSSTDTLASGEVLTLYAIEGTALRRVVDALPVWRLAGTWDGQCAGRFTETRATLRATRARGTGFADLALRQTRDERTAASRGKACVERKSTPSVRRLALRYDGQGYPLPAGL